MSWTKAILISFGSYAAVCAVAFPAGYMIDNGNPWGWALIGGLIVLPALLFVAWLLREAPAPNRGSAPQPVIVVNDR